MMDLFLIDRSAGSFIPENSTVNQNSCLIHRSNSKPDQNVGGGPPVSPARPAAHHRSTTGSSSKKQKFSEDEELLMYIQMRSGFKNLWKKMEKYFSASHSKQEVLYHCNYWMCQKGLINKYKRKFAEIVNQQCLQKNIPFEDIDYYIDHSQQLNYSVHGPQLTEFQLFVRSIEIELTK